MFVESVAENNKLVSIGKLGWSSDFADVFLEAVKELNHDIGDMNLQLDTGIYFLHKMFQLCIFIYNDVYPVGFMKAQLTMENGRRWSSDKVLHQKPNHPNLTLLTHARASKVSLFEGYCFFTIHVKETKCTSN